MDGLTGTFYTSGNERYPLERKESDMTIVAAARRPTTCHRSRQACICKRTSRWESP